MPWKVSGRSCQDCVNYLLKNGKIYAISDTDGKFLCDLYQPDYLHLENGGDIVDTASIPDMHFHSDWAIGNPTVRDKVLSSRMVIIYTHETVTL